MTTADSPFAWAMLTIVGLFYIGKFLYKIVQVYEEAKTLRQKEADEYFSESAIDKRNAMMYNRFMNGGKRK